ncbi:MAG: winged helix DNA-binding domain-containing protein, partial [Chloroflexi bacterium]|nr:winged helix DNA-binding domain-containing protein [Chloroflexota bacterium]
MQSLSLDQARLLRLRAQRLPPDRQPAGTKAAAVVKGLGGVQAQEAPAAALAIRARCAGLTAGDVETARQQERSLVYTWLMRGTLHLVATEDLGWLLPLLGPLFTRQSRRQLELGLDEATRARGIRALRRLLAARGPLTRAELTEALAGEGVRLEGQAVYHLIHQAALAGIVCRGPERDGEPAYVLVEEWLGSLGPALPPEQAAAELARRYLAGYGPARPEDLATWSGLSPGQARGAWQQIAAELLEVEIAGQPAWMLQEHVAWLELPAGAPAVSLLPGYDAYLLGYHGRELAIAPEYARRLHPGGGLLRPAVLVNGVVVGTWKSKRKRKRKRLEIEVEPFEPLGPAVQAELQAEAEDIGRFLQME